MTLSVFWKRDLAKARNNMRAIHGSVMCVQMFGITHVHCLIWEYGLAESLFCTCPPPYLVC